MSLFAGETLERFQPHFELLFGSNGDLIGIQNPRANGADLRFSSDGTETIGTLNVTSSLNLYNTTPISSTNYERLRMDWSSNVARLWTQNDGTGTGRSLRVGTGNTDGAGGPESYSTWTRATNPYLTHSFNASSATGIFHELYSHISSGFTGTGGTQTAVAVSPTFAQTSTAAGIALLVNPSGTFGSGGGKLLSLQLAGTEGLFVNTGGGLVATGLTAPIIGFNALGSLASAADILLWRDAAATLAQRNGTNAQTFRVYRSYTDSSNYSRWSVSWNTSTALLKAEGAGTGTNGNTAFGSAALATNATVGYVMIPSCAGVPTGVPADIPTGQVALHFDSTNNKLYVYNGGWISTAALT